MKRIVVLIDGTWSKEGTGAETNVAKLHVGRRIVEAAFIKAQAADGTIQCVRYHAGVGTTGGFFDRILGGLIGFGLKRIIKDAYNTIVDDFAPGDEVYLIGFSRGAYAARALAGLIGAAGIQRSEDGDSFEAAWRYYRVNPELRAAPQKAGMADRKAIDNYRSRAVHDEFYARRAIKCVAVWETVGAYGVPAGIGLTALARYIALIRLGFHDTHLGDHVAGGLHAIAVDEHRRSFVPTFWTMPIGRRPKGHVEQTWFAGAHSNVGGGYTDSGLSDVALIWMIARLHALTGLEFDAEAIIANTRPNLDAAVVDSTKGWPIDTWFPHFRAVLPPVAVKHGYVRSRPDDTQQNVNERVHWSVIAKRERSSAVPYAPTNLPAYIAPASLATPTAEEAALQRDG
jgi:uncharacterized protein (DUF2235 family)